MHSDLALFFSIGDDRTILMLRMWEAFYSVRKSSLRWPSVYNQGVTGRQISLSGKTWGILCLGICIQLVWSLLRSIIHT